MNIVNGTLGEIADGTLKFLRVSSIITIDGRRVRPKALQKRKEDNMSTRCNVTFFDRCESGWKEGSVLYHHSDGYPEAMVPKLEHLLRRAMTTLHKNGYGVDSEKVAALIVVDSVRPDEVPSFCPCRRIHDDIDYKYEVYIDENHPEIHATDRHGHAVGSVTVEVGGDV